MSELYLCIMNESLNTILSEINNQLISKSIDSRKFEVQTKLQSERGFLS